MNNLRRFRGPVVTSEASSGQLIIDRLAGHIEPRGGRALARGLDNPALDYKVLIF